MSESGEDKGIEEGQVQEVVTTSPGTGLKTRKRNAPHVNANNQGNNKKSKPNSNITCNYLCLS